MERMQIMGSKASVIQKGEWRVTQPRISRKELTRPRPLLEIGRMFEKHLPGSTMARGSKAMIPQPYVTPIHRRANKAQIGNMMKSWRRRERLDRHPLLAVHLLAKLNTDRMYW